MSHCMGGPGAYRFGQRGPGASNAAKNDSDHNVLLALVEWVEGGREPEVIVGSEDSNSEEGEVRVREHCRWPGWRSVWDGEEERWVCAGGYVQRISGARMMWPSITMEPPWVRLSTFQVLLSSVLSERNMVRGE